MKKPLLWRGRMAAAAVFYTVCRWCSYPLAQSGLFLGEHFVKTSLLFLLLLVVQGALSYFFTGSDPAMDRRYALHVGCVLAVVAFARAVAVLYNIDASATLGETAVLVLCQQPAIWLLHGAAQAAFVLADRALRFRPGDRIQAA